MINDLDDDGPVPPETGDDVINEFNDDRTGWARFSADRTMRYRLARSLTNEPREPLDVIPPNQRAVFVMLNPSTADAFVVDPTVRRCIGFAQRWGVSALEVVNLFALRSKDPAELYRVETSPEQLGSDHINTAEILEATRHAKIVVCAWGNHGAIDGRAAYVVKVLTKNGVTLHHFGLTMHGHPKHPLYIKSMSTLTRWTP